MLKQRFDSAARLQRLHDLQAQQWFAQPHGQQLLEAAQPLLEEALAGLFGGYLVHCGPAPAGVLAPRIQRQVCLGPPGTATQIHCEEHAWPLAEHAADVVVLQHSLEFSASPQLLLREAARCVRPGGHLLICAMNPWSSWGVRQPFADDAQGLARCLGAARLSDWLGLLGFALEKRAYGCYRPPLSSVRWQQRLQPLERLGARLHAPGAGLYLLVARKLVVGLRPLQRQRREPMGKLLPMPVAKVSRRNCEETKS